MQRSFRFALVAVVLFQILLADATVLAQQKDPADRTVRPLNGVPEWLAKHPFRQKEFLFVRVQYSSVPVAGRRRPRTNGSDGRWSTDYPDADLNMSAQLRNLTTLNVDPKGKVVKLTDPQLAQHPFIYMSEPGSLLLSDDEVQSLRKYLLEGGFLMVDDFWGENEWQQFHSQIKRVFPDREPTELPLEHKVFHCVFDLKEKPQVPSIHAALAGNATERFDAVNVHYRGIFDDKGRMMAIICHNTDLADGWERIDVDEKYYREYSEKKAYPMGINIIFFALTQGN